MTKEANPERKAKARPNAKPEARKGARPDAKLAAGSDARPDRDADAGTEAKTETKAEAKTETKTDAKTETKTDAKTETKTEAGGEAKPDAAPVPGAIPRRTWLIVGGFVVVLWAFAINTGNRIVLIVAGVITAVLAGLVLWLLRYIRKQRSTHSLLQGAIASPEARRQALAKLSEGKDARTPTNVFARAQLLAADDDPQGALELLGTIELKSYPPAMQDDVSLLQAQLYLRLGRTADARKSADLMNLDNPQRKEIRALAASIVAEAWARTGKPKEALALLDTIELPKKDAEQIGLQIRVARVFARFAANQRGPARAELVALADDDFNQLGRFVQPQFRVHPELQKLARSVIEQHPAARRHIKAQTKRR